MKVRIIKGINIPTNYRNYIKNEIIEVFEKDKYCYGTHTEDKLVDDIPKKYVKIM